MRKYDKSLIEVWEWKEKVYQDVKDLSAEEYLKKIKNDTDKIFSETGIELNQISSKRKHRRVV